MDQKIPELSFPYPTGTVYPPRQRGMGCTACIHRRYCGAIYWHRRFEEREIGPDYGVACSKWSDKKEDIVRGPNEGDLYQIEYMENQRISGEPNQNGADDSF